MHASFMKSTVKSTDFIEFADSNEIHRFPSQNTRISSKPVEIHSHPSDLNRETS